MRYDNVHDMKRDCEVVGWDLDYHQIEPGRLTAYVAARKVGDIWVMIKQVNLQIDVVGTPPDDHVTLISPDTGQTVWANGFRLDDSGALLLQPNAALHLSGGPTTVVQAHVPFAALRRLGMSDEEIRFVYSRDGALAVSLASVAAEPLRWLLNYSILADNHSARQDRMLADSAGLVIKRAIERQSSCPTPRSEPWRTISRAREFIESNLHRPINIRHVSDHAVASVSKLERTFRRELRVTPSRYVLARRLSAVNRDLKSIEPGHSKISDLAMHYGFTHLGRFSAAYRAQFGELPSETLQAQAP